MRPEALLVRTPAGLLCRAGGFYIDPLRPVDRALVEGLQRSTRHKSGLTMRFPRIHRLRWDKAPGEADRLETLETMLDLKTGATTHDRAGSGRTAPAG
jgi:hypothetical protein